MARARADNRARLRPYVVTRDYALFGKERDQSKAEVTAELTFSPPDSKTYSILRRSGSGLGERLVRQILDGETEIGREEAATDFSDANYEFRFDREERVAGQLCYVLDMSPRREDKTLLRGRLWVDADTYLLHRLEGEPAKSPSWWLTDARITFLYGDVQGMWLQTASEFTTSVRLFGEHSIVSHDFRYTTQQAGGALPGANSLSSARREDQGSEAQR